MSDKEKENLLKLGVNHATEKPIRHTTNQTIAETENTTGHLDEQLQKGYQIIAQKKVKQILSTDKNGNLQYRQHIVKCIK
jgi:hypothetical protein